MKSFTSAFSAKLALPETYIYGLVRIGPFNYDSSVVAFTTSSEAVTFEGTVYSPISPLVSMDPPRLSSSVDREVYKILLSDPAFVYRERLEAGAFGTPILVYATVGAISGTAGIVPVLPYGTSYAGERPAVVYKGTLDSFLYTVDEEGAVILELTCTSPMGSLALTRAIPTSPNWMRQRFPGDVSYDQVSEGSQQIALLWGRTQA
jgi:hypothetical protein